MSVKALLLFGPSAAIMLIVLGRRIGQHDADAARAELAGALSTTQTTLETVIAQKRIAEEELRQEKAGCDRLFVWYERCLDGRSCTEAEGEQLWLHRHFDQPVLPHMRPPWEKASDKPLTRSPDKDPAH